MVVPDPLPGEIVLNSSRLKWLFATATGAGFAGIGAWMIATEPSFMAWVAALFFGPVALAGAWMMLSGGGWLQLDGDGFEQSVTGRRRRRRREEASPFGCYALKRGPLTTDSFVSFDEPVDTRRIAEVNRGLIGASAQLEENFRMKPQDLAALMNAFRDRALAAKGGE